MQPAVHVWQLHSHKRLEAWVHVCDIIAVELVNFQQYVSGRTLERRAMECLHLSQLVDEEICGLDKQ